MKIGDLVKTIDGENPDLKDFGLGLFGIIVRPVKLEDGHPINTWCDWWVLINGELQPWSSNELIVVQDEDS